ncbi:MAG: hypothetical protein AB1499_15200 [Nitrospirota bacterium]
MKTSKEKQRIEAIQTWEESSGLISFLSSVTKEVAAFNDTFELGVIDVPGVLRSIDGDTELPRKAGFVLQRYNALMPEVTYCLYSVLHDRSLYGYIGTLRDGNVKTLKTLDPITDFKKGKAELYEWLRQLVRASFEKTML